MATTGAGTPYVESSDLVANYPAVSEALANQVDTKVSKSGDAITAPNTTTTPLTLSTPVNSTATNLQLNSGANPTGSTYARTTMNVGGFGGRISGFLTQGVGGGVTIDTIISGTATERLSLSGDNGLITGTGVSLGAWTSYTPSFTNFTLGSGTVDAKYMRIGKLIIVQIQIILAADSAWPTSTNPFLVSLPGNVASANMIGNVDIRDASVGKNYTGKAGKSGNLAALAYSKVNGTVIENDFIAGSTPFTPQVSDEVNVHIIYETSS